MPRLPALAAALALFAGPAPAADILYATAATLNRIDGFCLRGDGSLAPDPTFRLDTVREPRRLVVRGTVLYVAGRDEVVAYRIGNRGALTRIGAIASQPNMDVRDLAFNAEGSVMYVPQRGYDRIAAFRLDADGAPERDFASCIQGAVLINYLNAAVAPCTAVDPPGPFDDAGMTTDPFDGMPYTQCLYVSADGQPGRIDVHGLFPDGSLKARRGTCTAPCAGGAGGTCCSFDDTHACTTDADCDQCRQGPTDAERPPRTAPISTRRRIQKPKEFVVRDGFLYVEERARRRILSFQLQPDGTFCDRPISDTEPEEPCAPFLARKKCARTQARKSKRKEQCAASVTSSILQYEDLVLAGDTLLGTQFFKGRVDSYRLRPDARLSDATRTRLPQRPTRTSRQDVLMTPVRATAHGRALYVAAGELDRVIAYRLRDDGVLAAAEPFSRSAEQKNSFPNDVAVAVLPGACE